MFAIDTFGSVWGTLPRTGNLKSFVPTFRRVRVWDSLASVDNAVSVAQIDYQARFVGLQCQSDVMRAMFVLYAITLGACLDIIWIHAFKLPTVYVFSGGSPKWLGRPPSAYGVWKMEYFALWLIRCQQGNRWIIKISSFFRLSDLLFRGWQCCRLLLTYLLG